MQWKVRVKNRFISATDCKTLPGGGFSNRICLQNLPRTLWRMQFRYLKPRSGYSEIDRYEFFIYSLVHIIVALVLRLSGSMGCAGLYGRR
jgi:hypothetical protein